MPTKTITLIGQSQRSYAKSLIDQVPAKSVVKINDAPTRTQIQNDKMWAMLEDISKARPRGLEYTREEWKILFMHKLGREILFMIGLDGQPFPAGFSSKKLSVGEMADLITIIYQYGDDHGVQWSEPKPAQAA